MLYRFGLMFVAAALAFPAGAAAMPFSYYREHKAWCDASLIENKDQAFDYCANRDWCAAHGNDDRITRIYCDPFRSRADPSLRHRVSDFIGPDDAVDPSVLVNEISRIIARHWKDVPGG
jgi:hypothetical protein